MRQPQIVIVPGETRTEYVTRTVHEHRAPTDESIKLLKEMESAAEARVVEAVKVGDTTFECVIHTMQDAMSDQTVMRAVFSLNGTKMTAEHRFNGRFVSAQADPYIALRDEIAKVIATRMIEGALRERNRK